MPRSSICPFKAKPYLRLRTQARGKLMEDPHYQLFTCLKLSFGTEKKEMTAVVHCLRTWRHYLLRVFLISLLLSLFSFYHQRRKRFKWPDMAAWNERLERDQVSHLRYKKIDSSSSPMGNLSGRKKKAEKGRGEDLRPAKRLRSSSTGKERRG